MSIFVLVIKAIKTKLESGGKGKLVTHVKVRQVTHVNNTIFSEFLLGTA